MKIKSLISGSKKFKDAVLSGKTLYWKDGKEIKSKKLSIFPFDENAYQDAKAELNLFFLSKEDLINYFNSYFHKNCFDK